jgi:hypothetical protein
MLLYEPGTSVETLGKKTALDPTGLARPQQKWHTFGLSFPTDFLIYFWDFLTAVTLQTDARIS